MNPERLCIRIQPADSDWPGNRWAWEVAYPQGMTCKRGEADTAEHAFALAKLALELLTPEKPTT